jgi:TorA maturation chaperone TorD
LIMKQATDIQNQPAWLAPYANIRLDSYVLLAAFLNRPPTEDLLNLVRNLRWDEDIPETLYRALNAVNQAGNHCPAAAIAEEFYRLFVGLGSGEMVPYGSWYREKMIQSAPLASIRSDLMRLGIVKRAESFESEDHAGALCEVMALLIQAEDESSPLEQLHFFDNHIGTWMMDFFRDLESVKYAEFYRTVGAFGCCFLEAEREYLQNIHTAS